MTFKLSNPPYKSDNTPIYRVKLEEGVVGKANNNGTIVVKEGLTPEQEAEVISHEQIHIDQMKRGDLDYDDDNVYWKGKKYSRADMEEGAKNLPWEAEAYKRS
jgi:hypothetical protein